MKYLSDYVQDAQSALFEETGTFFAFGRDQFEEGVEKNKDKKPEGTKWASLGAGMYCPSVNVDKLVKGLEDIEKKGVEQDLAENGRDGVLQRELGNYEIGLAWEGMYDENFRDAIKPYGFTEEEIKTNYKKHMAETEY